jgi:hypothetical protein
MDVNSRYVTAAPIGKQDRGARRRCAPPTARPERPREELTLPTFSGGAPRVDISNRDLLYEVMERR